MRAKRKDGRLLSLLLAAYVRCEQWADAVTEYEHANDWRAALMLLARTGAGDDTLRAVARRLAGMPHAPAPSASVHA